MLRKRRSDAFAYFLETGFPTTKTEAWKYTSLRSIAETAWIVSEGAAPTNTVAQEIESSRIAGTAELVVIGGRVAPELSRGVNAASGFTISRLSEVLSRRGDELAGAIGTIAAIGRSPLSDLNTALFPDAVCIEIAPRTVVSAPIHLLLAPDDDASPNLTSPRVLILAGKESQATLIETYTGTGRPDGSAWTNAVTEVSVGEGAHVEHCKMQQEPPDAYHIHRVAVRQARGSSFTSHNVALGAKLARTDIEVLFDGEGGDCTLNGLFIGSGSQHLDTHTTIDHARPHCTSRELYKGILDGRSRGVFHGTIVVRPGAQKTDAMQTNKNLLLSREALVDSTPVLEILADDVKCKHGSTIGQLDANALFYLRSRGIGEKDARTLLTYAFAADVANRIRFAPVRQRVESALGRTLSGGRGSLSNVETL